MPPVSLIYKSPIYTMVIQNPIVGTIIDLSKIDYVSIQLIVTNGVGSGIYGSVALFSSDGINFIQDSNANITISNPSGPISKFAWASTVSPLLAYKYLQVNALVAGNNSNVPFYYIVNGKGAGDFDDDD